MDNNKKTLILGASENPERYSNKAKKALSKYGLECVLIGKKAGEIDGQLILTGTPNLKNTHTVSVYLAPKNQIEYYDYIIDLKPKRVIFNPGTENFEFEEILKKHKIQAEQACTLVLLSIGEF